MFAGGWVAAVDVACAGLLLCFCPPVCGAGGLWVCGGWWCWWCCRCYLGPLALQVLWVCGPAAVVLVFVVLSLCFCPLALLVLWVCGSVVVVLVLVVLPLLCSCPLALLVLWVWWPLVLVVFRVPKDA